MASDLQHSFKELDDTFDGVKWNFSAITISIEEMLAQAKHLGAIRENAVITKVIEPFADHDDRGNRSLVDCILAAIAPLCRCGRKLDDPEITPCDRCEWLAAGRPEEDFEKAERDGEVS